MENVMIIQNLRQMLLKTERIRRNDGSNQFVARLAMARDLKVSLGTVENIIRMRVKSVSAGLRDQIHQMWIKTTEAELARLEHEHELALQTYAAQDPAKVAEMEECLEKARTFLAELARERKGR